MRPALRNLASLRFLACAFVCACAASAPSPQSTAKGLPAASAPAAPSPTPTPATPARVHVQLLAINDFHGNLEPPAGTNGVVVASTDDPIASLPGTRVIGDAGIALVPAGGAAFLATHIAKLRAENPRTIVLSAGDLTGASPLLSNVFKDEPSVLVMNRIGLEIEGVGNHDFDRGTAELLRLQQGGCSLGDCDGGAGTRFPGASFTYLAANVLEDATQKTLFPPYVIRELGGAKIAFVGETLQETPSMTVPSAVKGLTFQNEASTVNALVPELKNKEGASAIVLVLHQGGTQSSSGTYDSCVGFSGDLAPILDALDPAIDLVVSAHTHQAYDCRIGGRLVTSAGSYGRLVTKIDLTLDPAARRVVEKQARNVPVTRDVVPDAEVEALIREYKAKGAAVTGRVVGYVKSDLTANAKAAGSASCETPLGDYIADAQAAATRADIALMNPGGIRADFVAKRAGRPDFALTYAEVFEVQPFGNTLVTLTMTGAELRALLEAQFGSRAEPRIFQVSKGLSYAYTYDRATRRGTIDALRLRGKPILPAKSYRVTVNSFLAGGGDGFGILKAARERAPGTPGDGSDLDALTAYLAKTSSAKAPLEPARTLDRIHGDGCK